MEWRWGRLWCIFNWRSFEETRRALRFNYALLPRRSTSGCKSSVGSWLLPVAAPSAAMYVSDCIDHKRRSQRFWAQLPLCVQIWIVEMLGIKMENRPLRNCWAIPGTPRKKSCSWYLPYFASHNSYCLSISTDMLVIRLKPTIMEKKDYF